nr:hypothetical protein [Tanacetum cinerariifolium]
LHPSAPAKRREADRQPPRRPRNPGALRPQLLARAARGPGRQSRPCLLPGPGRAVLDQPDAPLPASAAGAGAVPRKQSCSRCPGHPAGPGRKC